MVSRRALSLDHPLESQIIMLSYRGNSQFMDFDNPNMLDSIIPSIANQYIELYVFFLQTTSCLSFLGIQSTPKARSNEGSNFATKSSIAESKKKKINIKIPHKDRTMNSY